MASRTRFPLAVVASLAAIVWPAVARPCAPAPPANEHVHTVQEDALIVWDEARHVEHFIRTAVFDTSAKSFGFLVPTPSPPTLAEVQPEVFSALAAATKPLVEYRQAWVAEPVGCTWLAMKAGVDRDDDTASAPAARVRVLSEQHVAGLDATVLAASDTAALAEWLRSHGFAMRDALQRWLAVYVEKGWNLVAFRYERPLLAQSGGAIAGAIQSSAVRITFAADGPVYPYLEPDDTPSVPDRELRLFVAADRRLDGSLTGSAWGRWQGSAQFAAAIETPHAVASALPGLALPERLWLHEFSDPTTKRPPLDLVFGASPLAEVRPPPRIVIIERKFYVPYELPLVALGAFLWWWRRRAVRRSRAGGSA
jgi:hypothetical protein